MPPGDFESLASAAFDEIKRGLGNKVGDATYRRKRDGRLIKNIQGIFDDRAQQVDPDTEQVISSNLYTFGVKLADIQGDPEKGDQVIVKGVTYTVVDSLEDGVQGVSTVLVLHRLGER